jgi:two-component system heavy metal sensor histidine kinase CusS
LITAFVVALICAIAALFLHRSLDREVAANTVLEARFVWLGLGLTVLAGTIAFFAGALLVGRACKSLRQVCDQVRAVRATADGAQLGIPGAPDEVREVIDAVSTALGHAHSEAERTRLLTTGLAHELGSPLQNLIGETEVALMSERTSREYRDVLHSHLEELRDIGRAIGNLMTLCTLSGQSPPADVEEFDLGREASMRLRREHTYAERRGVTLAMSQDGDLTVVGDREALLLAVANVVANAIDWSPRGGRVELALAGREHALEVRVDDGGPGIAADERSKIFEPFYRGPAAKGKRAGYGLGLSITKKAVETHGGALEVEASPLGGARFTLRLPRVRRADARVA